jgi:purine nucleoside permease
MPQPLPVRLVIVTMYENLAEASGHFGEFRLWVERLPLPETVPFPCGLRDLRCNREKGVVGVVSGVGTARAAASIMALGLDSRFDLSHSYWLVAGIAGVNPHEASLGSAAWVEWVVDADLAFEIDAREIPQDWPTGYLPLGRSRPYEEPPDPDGARSVYRLDPGLVAWAHALTADTPLPDAPALQAARAFYVGQPAACRPPFVLRGDEVAGSTFWHGELLNQHHARWLAYWTGGRGRFVMTAMEETGTLQALSLLARAGRVDWRRVLVLRAGSNYTMPPPGVSAAENLTAHSLTKHAGYRAAIEAAYLVGRPVVDRLVENWERFAEAPPTAP